MWDPKNLKYLIAENKIEQVLENLLKKFDRENDTLFNDIIILKLELKSHNNHGNIGLVEDKEIRQKRIEVAKAIIKIIDHVWANNQI